MPGGDRRGPAGTGAMSGRAAGYCSGAGMPGVANVGFGRGFRMGYGRGRGWRHVFYATGQPGWQRFGGYGARHGYPAPYQPPDPDWEKQSLRQQADMLQSELEAVKNRLSEVEAESVKD